MISADRMAFINGTRIVPDHNCLRATTNPMKRHTKKSNMSYHRRIQKKWNKRYGFETQYDVLMFNDALGQVIVCHPKIYEEIMRGESNLL